MSEFINVNCLICGSERSELVFTGSDRLLGLPGEFKVVQCADCGFIFTNPQPSTEQLAKYYPSDYGVYSSSQGVSERVRIHTRQIASRINRQIPKARATVLDIGCGDGSLLAELQTSGWNPNGIEMNAELAKHVEQTKGFTVYPGRFEDYQPANRSLDLVVLSHALEHFQDPKAVLMKCGDMLKNNGYIYISLPNSGSFERKFFGEKWYGWDLPRHLYHFNIKTLTKLLNSCGFSVKHIHYQFGIWMAQSLRTPRFSKPSTEVIANQNAAGVGSGIKETLKTLAFRALLATGNLAGKLLGGEIIEIIAVKD